FSSAEMAQHDVLLLGGAADNAWVKTIAERCGLELGNGLFAWQGKTYNATNEGLAVVLPNPENPQHMVTILAANSALELYQMAKALPRFPQWALFRDDQIFERGYHETGLDVKLE
ncbi:MAG TPA: hypothetical protein PL181_14315, partial [bacterium]|nr:hypothetical protein [bacterium]